MAQKMDLTDKKFGLLTVLRPAPLHKCRSRWFCRCECGLEKAVATEALTRGSTISCGSCGKKKHGMDGTPIYRLWCRIRERCYTKTHKDYPNYGARGIRVCDRWHDFKNFLEDMGPHPGRGLSLDRIDVNKDYSPENCRWASRSQQQMNKRIMGKTSSYRGVSISNGKYIRAHIRHDGKVIQLGTFNSEEAAARAYDAKARELRGPDARLNFKY